MLFKWINQIQILKGSHVVTATKLHLQQAGK